MPGETIRSNAYDLQEKLNIIQSQEPSRVPNADGVLKEQLVLGLKDDLLQGEKKRRVKAEKDLTFIQLMQEAITWSEEEEVQVPSNLRSSTHSRCAFMPPLQQRALQPLSPWSRSMKLFNRLLPDKSVSWTRGRKSLLSPSHILKVTLEKLCCRLPTGYDLQQQMA